MKKLSCVVVTCIFILMSTTTVRADDWAPPNPFHIISEDGSRVFHFNPNDNVWWTEADKWAEYPRTGLYYNTTPLEPIYFVENISSVWSRDFIFTSDMMHFVVIPQANAPGEFGDTSEAFALVFYSNGVVQKTYMVSDLVRISRAVLWSTTTAQWVIWPSINHDASNDTITLTTRDLRTYKFNITTGRILRRTFLPLQVFLTVTALGSGGVMCVGLLKMRKYSKQKIKQEALP